MKKLCFILIFSMVAQSAYGVDLDEQDKQKHVVASTAIAMPTYMVLRKNNFNRFESASIAVVSTLFLGFLKESSDKRFDHHDMQANYIGTASGVAIPLTFEFEF